MRQNEIARELGLSHGHFSQILSGSVGLGKRSAKKIGRKVGKPWNEIIAMNAKQLRVLVENHFSERGPDG